MVIMSGVETPVMPAEVIRKYRPGLRGISVDFPLRGKSKPVISGGPLIGTKKRIVLVCPFSDINDHFIKYTEECDTNVEVDVVSDAESQQFPFVDAEKREDGKGRPFCIVDFQHLHSQGKIVRFGSYKEWALMLKESQGKTITPRALYVVPGLDLMRDINRQVASYFPSFDKKRYQLCGLSERLESDVHTLLQGNALDFSLLYNSSANIESSNSNWMNE